MAALFKAAIAKPPRLLPEAEQRLPLFRADGRQHEACQIFLARGVSWRVARSLDSDCLSRHCGVLGPWASGWKPDLGVGPVQTIDGNKLRVCPEMWRAQSRRRSRVRKALRRTLGFR